MTALHTWMFIAFTILIGLAAGFSARAEELQLKITTRDSGTTYLAVTPDDRIVALVCKTDLTASALRWSTQYSADIVFPNGAGVLDVKDYRSNVPARVSNGGKNAYRPMSADNAKVFCEDPTGYFMVNITDDEATVRKIGGINAQSFGINRIAY